MNVVAYTLIVWNDARNFKNINTFKVDNDDEKHLRGIDKQECTKAGKAVVGMKIDAVAHMMQMT